jgi:hypothetical protein
VASSRRGKRRRPGRRRRVATILVPSARCISVRTRPKKSGIAAASVGDLNARAAAAAALRVLGRTAGGASASEERPVML